METIIDGHATLKSKRFRRLRSRLVDDVKKSLDSDDLTAKKT